ncbi:FxLYD domain-containing protein [Streptomyces niveus]|uniref:FxLYD domain-containing protein n=1 Tax=Streptomyces niveus TaxID=193462 RepID=UPI003442565D
MKIRHVRAIAVFGIAVFALTGARGSSGGGCSSSSGSSSSSGGSHSDSDYDDDYDSDSTSGSSTTGGSVTGGSTADAGRDLTIASCKYDSTAQGFVAEITANNSGSAAYSYTFTVDFTDSAGATVGNTVGSIPDVPAGGTDSVEVTAVDLSSDKGASGGNCKVDNVIRMAA